MDPRRPRRTCTAFVQEYVSRKHDLNSEFVDAAAFVGQNRGIVERALGCCDVAAAKQKIMLSQTCAPLVLAE